MEKIYCIHCGTINSSVELRCSKCNKKLNPKDHPFLDYLKSKISDKYKGDLKDSIYSIIVNYIKSNLYGFILACSIIITATSFVINNDTSSGIKNVTKKPEIVNKIVYEGEGLTSLEVTKKYVEAIKDNDINMIKSLQLQTFRPDISNEIKGLVYENDGYGDVTQISTHELVENAYSFFKNNQNLYVGSSELVLPSGNYGKYTFNRFIVSMNYCYENVCDSEFDYDFSARVQIELIEVDGNYYIAGEEPALTMSYDEQVMYQVLLKYDGDTTKITEKVANNYFINCYDSIDKCFN